MKFVEFVNKNRNIAQASVSKKIAASLSVTEERNAFFNGKLFKKYDMVESNGVAFRVLEQCSNYYQVVDVDGNISRKFANQLNISDSKFPDLVGCFFGYQITSESAQKILAESNYKLNSLDNDDVGILKKLKEADKMDNHYKLKDKLTIAKIIADVVGVKHDAVSTPENLVAASIRQAKKDPSLMKNKAVLQNMIQIAKEAGINVSDKTFAVEEAVEKPNKDMTGTNCTKCKKDKYQERSQHDDMDGKVTCSCGHRVSRWKNYTEKNESVELEELSVNTLKSLRTKLLEGSPSNANEHPQMDDKPTAEVPTNSLPHGYSLHPNSETHRRQLIKKARGD